MVGKRRWGSCGRLASRERERPEDAEFAGGYVRRFVLPPALFASTLFVSAFLLFLVEPMVGKTLLLAVGLPFFVVGASAPLLQRWFADTDHPAARDPYFLYAASNLGSMLALAGYPVLVEPHLTLAAQRVAWTVGYGLLVLLIAG